MKRKILSTILTIFIFLFFQAPKINAQEVTQDDTKVSSYSALSSSKKALTENTFYTMEEGNELYKGINSNFRVHMLEQMCSEDNKCVTWAIKDETGGGFTKGTVKMIAEDYEKNHPGYKVIGGINADQYTTGQNDDTAGHDIFNPQPYYSFIADGERWFAVNYFGSCSNMVALKNNGEIDQLEVFSPGSKTARLEGFFIYVYDNEGNIEFKQKIKGLNEVVGDGETTVLCSYYFRETVGGAPKFKLNEAKGDNIYFVKKAELAYASNTKEYKKLSSTMPVKSTRAEDAFFGKGVISSIGEDATLIKGSFAIKTNNEELKNHLELGKKILVQYDYKEEYDLFNNVESAIGYHLIQRNNGIDSSIAGSYNTSRYTRSVIGRKSTGEIVLISVDSEKGKNSSTENDLISAFGINAFCKANDIVEAYQMDGGGSVQMYIREDNELKAVTKSRDYAPDSNGQRYVYNALLFVEKVIDIKTTIKNVTTSSVTLDFEDLMTHGINIEEYKVVIDSKEYKTTSKSLVIDNLDSNKKYNYDFYIKSGEKEYKIATALNFKTNKITPVYNGVETLIEGEKITITIDYDDIDKAVYDIVVRVDGYACKGNGNQFTSKRYSHLAEIEVEIFYKLNDGDKYNIIREIDPHFKNVKIVDRVKEILKNKMDELIN